MRKFMATLCVISMVLGFGTTIYSQNDIKNRAEAPFFNVEYSGPINAESCVLMEAESGRVLVSKNLNLSLAPASVTKIMTLLLVSEAVGSGAVALGDMVTVSEYAASMGGSQVFLKEGEVFSVEELIKAAVIASANDASVALAEFVAGSEDAFVRKMNARAVELGMTNTNFENTTGLDDTAKNHKTSSLDIAIMSRELIKYDFILKYSTLWQDTIRNGDFVLTNTNRLVRYYDGCTGLKTGSTSKAGFCISATAKRNNMHLIAVVMGAQSSDARNKLARELLDFGFSTYSLYKKDSSLLEPVPVTRGTLTSVSVRSTEFSCIVPKGSSERIEAEYSIPDKLSAPLSDGQSIGEIRYYLDGVEIGKSAVISDTGVEKIGFWGIFKRLLLSIFDKLS